MPRFPPLSEQATGLIGLTSTQLLYGSSAGAIAQSSSLTYTDSTKVLKLTSSAAVDTALTVETTATGQQAYIESKVSGTTGQDPQLRLTIPSGTSWYAAVDNSASDVFCIGTSTSVGAARVLQLDSGTNNVIRFGPDCTGQTIVTAGNTPHQIIALSTGGASPTLTLGTDTSGSALVLRTANTTRVTVTAAGSVVVGTGAAALATNATDGFLYIPTCAGTPTGVPSAQTGTVALVYDTTNNKMYVYNAAWKGGTAPGAWT